MPPLLLVSRRRPDLLPRFQAAFADFPGIEIVLDRRVDTGPPGSDRRQSNIENMLHNYGWAIVGEDATPRPSRPGARRILIADDHEDTRHLLDWVLRRAGHEVIHADDGDIALVKARAWQPDLAIVDMFLPERGGTEAVRALRSTPRPPKILAISAGRPAGGLDALEDATTAGADAVLPKPIDPKTLLGAVEKLVGTS